MYLVDCPPSLGLLTLNTLVAADSVLIPIQCEFYALEGLTQLLNTIRLVQRNLNPDLVIEGVLLTMYDTRLNLSRQVAAEVHKYFGDKVFETVIPRNVRLAEAPELSAGQSSTTIPIAWAPVGTVPWRTGGPPKLWSKITDPHEAPGRDTAMSEGRLGQGSWELSLETTPTLRFQLEPKRAPTPLPVNRIVPNPYQPRLEFDPAELKELAASIKASGLLQPIVVRPGPAAGTYELVAGERRLRAVRHLGWPDVPALVRDVDDRALLVLALVENIQRSQLGALEEAKGYAALKEEFGLTQGEIAEAVGKSRSAVANTLRLLALPASVRRLIDQGTLSAGHGRALLGLNDSVQISDLAKKAVEGRWSVRELEQAVRAIAKDGTRRTRPRPEPDPAVAALEEALQVVTGARVAIRWGGKGDGTIRIPFTGPRDLERVFHIITGKDAGDVVG